MRISSHALWRETPLRRVIPKTVRRFFSCARRYRASPLLCRRQCRMLSRPLPSPRTGPRNGALEISSSCISNLALGENPLHETFAKTIERVLDALDLDYVHANAEHAHGEGISSS